ncbi:hypothetical protein G6F31_012595 [Rhizopus arrhizus]|nr:hypothetical protein G6F31_012595 [Rhizopus arrhizus]
MEHVATGADVGHAVQVDQLAQPEVKRHATDHADRAHRQRQVEAVPHGQAVLGHGRAEDRRGGGMQHRCHGQRRGHAYRDADHHQQLHRHLHPARRLVRHAVQVVRAGAEEGVVHEAQAVGHAEHAGQQRGDRHRRTHEARATRGDRFGEQHFLGQEAVEQRHACHGRRRHHRQGGGDGHGLVQAGQAAQVARAGFVVHDPGSHEQRRLEGGVVEDVEHAGDHRHRRGQAEQQGDQAQVRDRRIGQQALQVVLEDRVPGADQQGQCADAADRVEEQVAAGQRRVQARQQEHAGLHHGGRVQVGRDRGRCRHRVRQPEVERELRTLGEDAGQHQEQRVRVQRAGADLLAGSQYHVQVEAADDAADQQHAEHDPRQHAQHGLVHQLLCQQVVDEQHAGDQGQGQQRETDGDDPEQQRFQVGQRRQRAQPRPELAAAECALLQPQHDRQQCGDAQRGVGQQRQPGVAGQAPAQHLARFVAVAVVGQQQHRGQREHHHAQRRHPSARADQRGQPGHAQADQRQRGEEVHVRPAIGAHRHHHVVAAMQQHRRQRRPQPGGGAGGFIAAERAHQQGTGGQVEQDGDENDCHRCSFAYPCGGGDGRGVAARQVGRTRYTVCLIVPRFQTGRTACSSP